jgi:uncharacterized membrane protein YdjX (TVP38/TMEM64 family)
MLPGVDDVSASPDPTSTRDTPAAPARRGLGPAGPVALVATVWPILGSVTMVSVAPFAAPWLRAQGPAGVAYFVTVLALLGAIAFAPTNIACVVAGWVFGFRAGYPAILGATVVGATLCYGVARTLAGPRVAATFNAHPKWELVRRALVEASPSKTLWLVALLRLSPVLPFGTTNVLMSTTRVPLPTYVAGTMLGLAPRMAVLVLAAAGSERLDLRAGAGWPLLIAGILATALCVVVMAFVGKRALDRATRQV